MSRKTWVQKWDQMSDSDLEAAARYYFWIETNFPQMDNHRLEEIVAEAGRRGKPEILSKARASLRKDGAGGM